ncbi:hypothetical protein RF11_10763 [Thelohanellus kitauei]|uniref:Uncharacterized protein n=1 Tax=Thelohanellus kitauei TaxID=669202 RepID=A0A0C2MTL1_THEKT|nr:hypothetical protein RF11_10763 [Thelohanellus kitauei]
MITQHGTTLASGDAILLGKGIEPKKVMVDHSIIFIDRTAVRLLCVKQSTQVYVLSKHGFAQIAFAGIYEDEDSTQGLPQKSLVVQLKLLGKGRVQLEPSQRYPSSDLKF